MRRQRPPERAELERAATRRRARREQAAAAAARYGGAASLLAVLIGSQVVPSATAGDLTASASDPVAIVDATPIEQC